MLLLSFLITVSLSSDFLSWTASFISTLFFNSIYSLFLLSFIFLFIYCIFLNASSLGGSCFFSSFGSFVEKSYTAVFLSLGGGGFSSFLNGLFNWKTPASDVFLFLLAATEAIVICGGFSFFYSLFL